MTNNEELFSKIFQLKEELKDKIIIPVHHYQHPDIVKFADIVGDSYKLALNCSKSEKEFIIFCGVLFMAEGARILAKANQKVLLPEPTALCPMADMADVSLVKKAFEKIKKTTNSEVAIVLYINSYADIKNFCGENNGAVCTSSNATKVIKYFLKQGKKIFFLPDYNLGKNTALAMNFTESDIVRVNKDTSFEQGKDLQKATFFLWDGFCPVHQRFSVADIENLRKEYKNIKIIVHPECKEEVVRISDFSGSTEMIYKTIKESSSGSVWGIGTETTFVERIANENKDKTIIPLRQSKCVNMIKNKPEHLLASLISIKEYLQGNDKLKFEIKTDPSFLDNAKKALNKMIEIVEN